MIFVSISSKASDEWWNSQTDEFKRQYLAEHPKSKWANPDYGKDPEPPAKKKKKEKIFYCFANYTKRNITGTKACACRRRWKCCRCIYCRKDCSRISRWQEKN